MWIGCGSIICGDNKTLRQPEIQARQEADFEYMVNLLCNLTAVT